MKQPGCRGYSAPAATPRSDLTVTVDLMLAYMAHGTHSRLRGVTLTMCPYQ